MRPSDYPGFARLLEEWEQKLKDSGFCDAEITFNGMRILKSNGSESDFLSQHPAVREAKALFFQRLGEHVQNTAFPSEEEQQIMCLYAQGITQVEIKRRLGIQGHKWHVYKIIWKWLHEWGLPKRSWVRRK